MKIEVVADEHLGARGAAHVATVLRVAVAVRGHAVVTFSGGSTARPLLAALARADVPWAAVHVLQVDERVAPDGDPDRNLTALRLELTDRIALPPGHLHAMPVLDSDLEGASARYAHVLQELCGLPPTLDLVHLGLGEDGHTASLVPGSPVLRGGAGAVAVTPPYRGRRRMTLTLPTLSRARTVLWFVNGSTKAAVVRRLVDGDPTIPAGKVERSRAILFVGAAAAAALAPTSPTSTEHP